MMQRKSIPSQSTPVLLSAIIGRRPGYAPSGSHAGGQVSQPYSPQTPVSPVRTPGVSPCMTPRQSTPQGSCRSSRYDSISPSRAPVSSPLRRTPSREAVQSYRTPVTSEVGVQQVVSETPRSPVQSFDRIAEFRVIENRPRLVPHTHTQRDPQSRASDTLKKVQSENIIESPATAKMTPRVSRRGIIPVFPSAVPVSTASSDPKKSPCTDPRYRARKGQTFDEIYKRMVRRSPSPVSTSNATSMSDANLLNEVLTSQERATCNNTKSVLQLKLEEFENCRSQVREDRDAEVQASKDAEVQATLDVEREEKALKETVQKELDEVLEHLKVQHLDEKAVLREQYERERQKLKQEIFNLRALLKEERGLKRKALAAEEAAIEAAEAAKQQTNEHTRASATAVKEREERIAHLERDLATNKKIERQSKRDSATIKEQQGRIVLLECELGTLGDRNSDLKRQIDLLNIEKNDAARAAQKKSATAAEQAATKDEKQKLEQQVASLKDRLQEAEKKIAAAAEEAAEKYSDYATAIEERDEFASQLERQRREVEDNKTARQEAHARWLAASQESQKAADQRIEALEEELSVSRDTAAEAATRDRERIKQLEQQVLGLFGAQSSSVSTPRNERKPFTDNNAAESTDEVVESYEVDEYRWLRR